MAAAMTTTAADAERCDQCTVGRGRWQESAPGWDTLYCTACGCEWTITIDEPWQRT